LDIDKSQYLTTEERLEYIKSLDINLKHVPIIRYVKIFNEFNNLKVLLIHVDRFNKIGKRREGLVYKSKEPINGTIISFKVISEKYLMKLKD
jgi:hypothetical protein